MPGSLVKKLNDLNTLPDKLRYLGAQLRRENSAVERFSIALYHPETDIVRTFYSTSPVEEAITAYEYPLSQARSLNHMAKQLEPRVIQDLTLLVPPINPEPANPHTLLLVEQGWRSSYTSPLMVSTNLLGFVFFNSRTPHVFSDDLLSKLDLYSQLIAQLIDQDQAAIRTLAAAARSTLSVCAERDPETGEHLERMAHYAQLIAKNLTPHWFFSDRQLQHILLFAPLHDLGKVVVPDTILLKPGKLSDEEFATMQRHAKQGALLLDKVVESHGLNRLPDIQMLKNIVLYHHERMDGTGYPFGLKGEAIPIEARIVAVADVFDALTTERPYKEAWSIPDALIELERIAGSHLDPECVEVFITHRDEVEALFHRFADHPRKKT